jgi:hypothetical protein
LLHLVTEIWASKICTDAALDALQRMIPLDEGTWRSSPLGLALGLRRAQGRIRERLDGVGQDPTSPPSDGSAARFDPTP